MKWTTCPECEEEFKVITDSLLTVTYCPLCGEDIDEALDEYTEDDFDEE